MMPDILEGLSPLQINYALSLPHSLLATMSLMCAAPKFEGLGDWLREARTWLPADLLADICLLVTFPGGYQRLTGELIATLPADAMEWDYPQLMAHLEATPGTQYQRIALRALARGITPRPAPEALAALLDQPSEWSTYLTSVESEWQPDTVAALLRDDKGLKGRLLGAMCGFWERVYSQEFEATRPLMERSLAFRQAQLPNPVFRDLFVAVTGRLIPEQVAELLPLVRRVTFIPSCYVGPYVAYTHYNEHLILYYNCRSAPAGSTVADGGSLYPPVKALADETRLQILDILRGRELYAQEIVEQLDISQPAVSRHLNLMVAAGVLQMRREGNTKYYSINGKTLAQLADALRTFV
jgi:hypothetical protein